MSRYAYVYVGRAAKPNFKIGMERRIWGWKQPRYGNLAKIATHWLADPPHPTYLAFVQGVTPATPVRGWPRTEDLEPWLTASCGAVTIARLAQPLYQATEHVWPDDTYEYRVRLDSITPIGPIACAQLRREAVEAIRQSTLLRGSPILGPEPLRDELPPAASQLIAMLKVGAPPKDASVLDDATSGSDEELFGDDLPDRLLDGLENLDGLAQTIVRVEQRALRRRRFGKSIEITCAICGRVLPVGLVRLAHIKRRAEAEHHERLMLENTMPACTLGCDELFERGYVVVDRIGIVMSNPAMKSASGALTDAIEALHGRRVHGYSSKQERFFASHRNRHNA